MTKRAIFKSHLAKNLFILFATVAVGWFLSGSQAFHDLLTASRESEIVGSFVGGIFFTSLFTTGPAAVALGTIARENSLLLVALLGGAGAVIGDYILFRFMKNYLTDELFALFGRRPRHRLGWLLQLRMFRWVLMVVGALIIALPLPDEIGLAMMGLSRIKTKHLIPLSFVLNSLGIAFIGLIARAL